MEAVGKNTEPRVEVIDFESRRYPRLDLPLPVEFDQIKSSITHTGNISGCKPTCKVDDLFLFRLRIEYN